MRQTRVVSPASELGSIRVVLADDDRLFAQMMRAQLSLNSDLEVVGIASDGAEAVALAAELEPDVVLMDVSMPNLDGIAATRLIREMPVPPMVVLVTGDDETTDARAYEIGAAAYVRKTGDFAALIDLIVAISQFVVAVG